MAKNCVVAETYAPVQSWEIKVLTGAGSKHSCVFCVKSFFIEQLLNRKSGYELFLGDESIIRHVSKIMLSICNQTQMKQKNKQFVGSVSTLSGFEENKENKATLIKQGELQSPEVVLKKDLEVTENKNNRIKKTLCP